MQVRNLMPRLAEVTKTDIWPAAVRQSNGWPPRSWRIKNRERFPVDVNLSHREMLLRVPGLGVRTVDRILSARQECAVGAGRTFSD